MNHKLVYRRKPDDEMYHLILDDITVAQGDDFDYNFPDMIRAIKKSFKIIGVELDYQEEVTFE